jgi:hypothetical protein
MTPEEAVRLRLLQIGAVSALVTSRIYMLKLPQNPTLPAVRVQIIGELDDVHLRGAGGTYQSRVQVDAYVSELGTAAAPDPYATVRNLAAAITGNGAGTGLEGWQGVIAGTGPLRITGIFRIDRDSTYEAAELRLLRMRQDFRVWWRPL